jgi:energy-coupling factor transporter ATP-binding protein EcfA2
MIVGLSIKNYKIFKSTGGLVDLKRFHVLVGPNASGKTTFLDALDFLKDCLHHGPRAAVEMRAPDFRDLTYMRRGGSIDIIVQLELQDIFESQERILVEYAVSLCEDSTLGIGVADEELRTVGKYVSPTGSGARRRLSKILGKTDSGGDIYYRENGNYRDSFVFGFDKLTLANTPPDEKRYPTANAVKQFLMNGVRYLKLNSRAMREPCRATRPTEFELDGSNIARVVGKFVNPTQLPLFEASAERRSKSEWVEYLKYALPDLRDIGWDRQRSDNAEYISLIYNNGLECPSWLLSDGTLRMLALTLLAFQNLTPAVYMVEEPENGVHPKALEIILKALQNIPRAQMLVATHSPLAVQQVGPDPLLCFSTGAEGASIVPAWNHPVLKDWNGIPDLATVFSSGILG